MVAVIVGVVNELPVPSNVPPVEASYHLKDEPEPVAVITVVPLQKIAEPEPVTNGAG